MTTKSNEKHLTKKELVSAFWRSFMITACFSMDRMQAAGFDFAMIPVLKKLYGDNKEKYSEALTRHAEAYNLCGRHCQCHGGGSGQQSFL